MLYSGFSRIDITPPLGICMQGYYSERRAEGILDPLEATCLAFRDGEGRTALVFSLDVISISQPMADHGRAVIAGVAGVPEEAVFLACTHTHTGPCMDTGLYPHDPVYVEWCFAQLGRAAVQAMEDLAPAKLLYARGEARGIAFVRRFRMKDGSNRTNPGCKNPDIRCPIGTPDETLRLVRVLREGKPEIDIVNFQVHPDVIGGCKWSADFPGFARRALEGAIPGIHAVYFNGAQGDTNHIDVSRSRDDPDTITFPIGGYEHSRYMGQVIAAGALAVWGTAQPLEGPDAVRYAVRDLETPANLPDPAEIPEAERIWKLHTEGHDDMIPYHGMELTTAVAEAEMKLRMAHADPIIHLHMSVATVGGLAFAGFAGEPFTDMGRGVREASPYEVTMACCCTNGCEDYMPMYSAFAEGGYEARSSSFTAGVAEDAVVGTARILSELYRMK